MPSAICSKAMVGRLIQAPTFGCHPIESSMRSRMMTDRSGLAFVEATRKAFAFLQLFGLRELSAETTIVRYASGRVYLNVYHGRSSYELGLEVGRLGTCEQVPGYTMSVLLGAKSLEQGMVYRNRIAVTPEEVWNGLFALASELKANGESVLSGEDGIFELLKQRRQAWAEEYAADVRNRQLLPRADEALRQHDYKTAA